MNVIALILVAMLSGPASDDRDVVQIKRTDDRTQSARLMAIDRSTVTVQVQDQTETFDVDSIESILLNGKLTEIAVPVRFQLVDGSTLAATSFTVQDRSTVRFSVRTDSGSEQEISVRDLDYVELNPPPPALRTQWQEMVTETERPSDLVIFQRDEALDYIEGTVEQITSKSVIVNTGSGQGEAPRSRLAGIAWFQRTGRSMDDPVAILKTVTGSQLFVQHLKVNDQAAEIRTSCGAELRLPMSHLVELDFESLRYQYLDAIEPSTIEWIPLVYTESLYEYEVILNRPRMNQSFDNEPLTLITAEPEAGNGGGSPEGYERGIAIKAGTRLVFPLNGRYSRLEGRWGFDPDAAPDGLVQLVIEGDGVELLREVMNHESDLSRELMIDVQGVNRLTIQLNYHDGRNVGDIIHLCNLRVSR